jgi:CRISPR-associated protein Cmr4
MYQRAYGLIEALAPLHVGASAGEETGNLNLIFRDQFTQTGIIPGSSIRGRFRADMRSKDSKKEQDWFGKSVQGDNSDTSEALVKFEYASIVWLPVFCPGQPIVWVTCPWLLKRYKQITGIKADLPKHYSADKGLSGRQVEGKEKVLFFNLGFLKIEHDVDLKDWKPEGTDLPIDRLVVVGDNDIAMIHDMALYRQSRVKLSDEQKKVEGGAFFNVEALPESSVLIFPIALKQTGWKPFGEADSQELYFGGLESIGFGRCRVTLRGDYQ